MATHSLIQRSFAAGELAPSYHARADLAKYLTGARTLVNWFIRKAGGISNRAGFYYVNEVKDSDDEVILLRYVSEQVGGSVLIEMGDSYFRFYNNGGLVTVSAVAPYDIGDPYVPGDIVSDSGVNYYCVAAAAPGDAPPDDDFWYAMPADDILEIPHGFGAHQPNWHQTGRVIVLTHGEVHPAELEYFSLTHWVLTDVTTEPWHAPPQSLAVAQGTPGPGNRIASYVVTAARLETYEETEPSDPDTTTGAPQLGTEDDPNVLTWDAVTGAVEYYVYCDPFQNGVYGYIGTAATNSFNDTGLVPDFAVTPPIARDLFDATNEYPHVSGTHEQRRVYGQTGATPDQLDLSRPGFPANFGVSSPIQDDDAIRFKLAGMLNHAIRWVVSLKTLIVGTAGGVHVIQGPGDGEPIIPAAGGINAKEHVHVGAHDKAPVVIGNAIVYLQSAGKIFRDVNFEAQSSATLLGGRDLTVLAEHLFEEETFARLDYAQAPHSIVWAVRNDGVLLGMTYLPDDEIFGWHRHTTQNGVFEDVCVVPEAGEDAVYVVVRRTIDGEDVRYIERLSSRVIRSGSFDEDVIFVDSALTYDGSPANHISGLDHLEGEVVAVVGDGTVVFDGDPDSANAASFTVTSGAIDLPADYSVVHVGLPIRFADVETLDLDVQGSEIRAARKRVASVTLLLDKSARGFKVGPDEDHLKADVAMTWEGSDTDFTGQVEVPIDATFNTTGRVFVRVTQPLPITILGIIPNAELGG
jgi:hypothetical protein